MNVATVGPAAAPTRSAPVPRIGSSRIFVRVDDREGGLLDNVAAQIDVRLGGNVTLQVRAVRAVVP